MRPTINEAPGGIDEHLLELFELEWDVHFPKPYRRFLLQHNGGHPEPAVFDFIDGRPGSTVDRLFSLNVNSHDNLIHYRKHCKTRIPRELFPIGGDALGNLICIGVQNQHYGKVYFWDHEREVAEGEAVGYSNVTQIARDFDEFMAGLHE